MRKKLITMGLVSALGASTSAWAVDLDDATDTPDTFTPDSVLSTDATTSDVGYVVDTEVMDTSAIGVGVASGNQVFMRFDLTNAVWDGAVAAADLTATMSATTALNIAVAQGGADEGSFVIFDITATAAITQGRDFSFVPGIAMTFDGAASVAMTVYETLTQAVNSTNSLYTISGVFATTAAGVATVTNADSATAEVSTDFTQFTGGATTAAIGDSTFDATAGTLTPADAAHTVADSLAVATSTVTLTGDVSFGDWYLNDAANCGGTDLDLTEDTDTLASATATNITAIASTTHYVCVDVDGTETINEGSYTISYGWDTPATAVFPLADTDEAVGSISRNGTTVEVPYLTTFADYNQRLVLVNRGATDAAYSISFTTEADTTATAGSAASGTIPAGTVLSLKATDIVSLSGKTRTAATLTVVAPSTSIDVATNQVNLSDGSTDTVVLN